MKALRLIVWWCVLLPLALVLLATLAGCGEREAPPMAGTCKPVVARSYSGGEARGPTRQCLWSGRRWDCTRYVGDGFGRPWWTCDDVGEAPAEAPK